MNFYEGGDDSVLPEEFEAAVVRHYDTLLRLAVQRAGSRTEAEDIVQDTFLQLLRSGRTFDDEEHLKAFLIRAVINRCKDYLKSARHTRSVELSEAAENMLPAAPPPDSGESEVLEAVRRLRPAYRDVIYLFYYEEYSIREIAQMLGKRENTISAWLYRARKKLKEVLEHEVYRSNAADSDKRSKKARDCQTTVS